MYSDQASPAAESCGRAEPPGPTARLTRLAQQAVRTLMPWTANGRSVSNGGNTKDSLTAIRDQLSGVSGSTEGVFLLVGERLMDLQLRTRSIADQTTSIAKLVLSETDSLSILGKVLSERCADNHVEATAGAIRGIQENATSIFRAIQAIGPVVKTFDLLGVMTRIESARVEGAGTSFVGLANSVATLSQKIREQIGTTADSATILLKTTFRAAEQMKHVAQKQKENLGPLARQTDAELQKMKEQRALVSDATKRLATRFNDVSLAIGDVVTALQSHDIVRQQIDHVLEALPGGAISDSKLAEIARLQAAQLSNSRTTFEASIRKIRESLAKIERNIGEVADESDRLLGVSGTTEESFYTSVESDLAGILSILDSNAAGDSRLAEAAVSVHERIAEITETIAGVQVIGLQMQRIALNATIQAARLGDDGAALEIIAQAIQALARDTAAAADELEKRLVALREGASALGNSTAGQTGADVQIAELRMSIESLRAIQDQARGEYSKILESTAGFKGQIRETIDTFGTQADCLEVLANTATMIRELSANVSTTGNVGLDQLAAMYTMQSERDVHQSLYEASAPNSDNAPVAAPPTIPEDNIEFF